MSDDLSIAVDAVIEIKRLRAENERLSEALREALSGLRYRRRKKK